MHKNKELDFAYLGSALLKNYQFLWTLLTYTGGPKITDLHCLAKKTVAQKSSIFKKALERKCAKKNGEMLNFLTFCSPQSKPCHPQINLAKSRFQLPEHNKLPKHSHITLSTDLAILAFVP